jgi:hypothetical protein
MSETPTQFNRERLTDAQRRRAEALILVKRLFPFTDAKTATLIAVWITSGRWSA